MKNRLNFRKGRLSAAGRSLVRVFRELFVGKGLGTGRAFVKPMTFPVPARFDTKSLLRGYAAS